MQQNGQILQVKWVIFQAKVPKSDLLSDKVVVMLVTSIMNLWKTEKINTKKSVKQKLSNLLHIK